MSRHLDADPAIRWLVDLLRRFAASADDAQQSANLVPDQ